MTSRGGYRGGFNSQSGYPKGQYDARGYGQSSGHGTPASSFHGSPTAQSPYGGNGRGWNNQPQFSPQRLVHSASHTPVRCASPLTDSTVANSRRHSPTTITDHPQARKGIITQIRRTLLRMRRRVPLPNTPQARTVEVTEEDPSGATSSPAAGISEVASRVHNGTPRATTAEVNQGRRRDRNPLMPRPTSLPVAMRKLRRRRATSP